MSDEVVLISLQAVYGNAYPRKTTRAQQCLKQKERLHGATIY